MDLFKQDFIENKNILQNQWQNEWQGMPEFIQDKQTPYSQIIFRFENENDLQEFSKLIGQKLTNKTKSAWFPFKSHFKTIKKIYINEK
jgi:hypothetical protein